jgi:hypothetical protein
VSSHSIPWDSRVRVKVLQAMRVFIRMKRRSCQSGCCPHSRYLLSFPASLHVVHIIPRPYAMQLRVISLDGRRSSSEQQARQAFTDSSLSHSYEQGGYHPVVVGEVGVVTGHSINQSFIPCLRKLRTCLWED